MNIPWIRRACWGLIVGLLLAAAWLHFAGKINLLTADLGRHLSNGRLFCTSHLILTTNFYSYTHPDFPALCHHWGIGPVLYGVWTAWGFNGLSVFYAGVLLLTFVLALLTAQRSSFTGAAVLAGVLSLPLVAYRIEIRPEGASTLFFMLEYFLLSEWRQGRVRTAWLWFLVLLQVVWVNTHILFFTGLVLTGIYWIDAKVTGARQGLGRILCWAVLASLANPFTLQGLSQPLTIFQGYGYDLAENQTVFFIMKRFSGPQYGYFLAFLMGSVMLLIARMLKERTWRRAVPEAMLLFIFGLMAVKSVRAIALFGFCSIPVVAGSLQVLLADAPSRRRAVAWLGAGLVVLAGIAPSTIWSPLRRFAPFVTEEQYRNSFFYVLTRPSLWSGLMPGAERSAAFFKAAGLKGPVFNNYDIGGYFIFALYPQERPFVDNRPEAYPSDFFRREYVPMQENETQWAAALKKYGFELIYFYRHDITPWAQPFLIRRLDDPLWAPVYADDYTIIFARRGGVNQALIGRAELPRAMFKATVK